MGIGIMSWGEKLIGYGKSHSFEDVFLAYQACLDAGLNYFDTAEMYGNGESERLLGECRRKDGRPIIIATKYAPHTLLTPSFSHVSPQAMLTGLDNSLKRLGVNQIDLFQLHCPPAQNKLEAYMDVMAGAVRSGKVRSVGLCNFSAALMRQAHKSLRIHGIPLASVMVGYSLLRRYPETNGLLDACRELDVALIAYAPLAEGILTGKYRDGSKPIAGIYKLLFYFEQLGLMEEQGISTSFFKRLFSKSRYLDFKRMEPVFAVLEETAQAHKRTIAQTALNWIMASDPRIIPIPGIKNLKYAKENIGALGWSITKDEFEKIGQAEIATR
jgi:aryl-alcohol dehydrogenase-like predicted oxidoreductase